MDRRVGFVDVDADSGEADWYYYLTDPAGSVVAVTDSDGNIVNRYDYDAFGNLIKANSFENVPNRYQFHGRAYDEHRGDYHYRMRVYVPAHGRFTGPDMKIDPLDPNGACNYLFCKNNPLVYSDPWGRDYIKVDKAGNVAWYAEKDQFFSSADIWPIGEVEDGSVKLREKWGGGSIPMDKLRDIAEGRFTGDERRTKAQRLLIRNAIRYGNDEEGALDIIEAGLWGMSTGLAAEIHYLTPSMFQSDIEPWLTDTFRSSPERPITKSKHFVRTQGLTRTAVGGFEAAGGGAILVLSGGSAAPAGALTAHGLGNMFGGISQAATGIEISGSVDDTLLVIPFDELSASP